MIVARTVADVRAALADRREGRIGLVPTMGAIHEGHRALLRAARETCDIVVMSLFVNPAQFGEQVDDGVGAALHVEAAGAQDVGVRARGLAHEGEFGGRFAGGDGEREALGDGPGGGVEQQVLVDAVDGARAHADADAVGGAECGGAGAEGGDSPV